MNIDLMDVIMHSKFVTCKVGDLYYSKDDLFLANEKHASNDTDDFTDAVNRLSKPDTLSK